MILRDAGPGGSCLKFHQFYHLNGSEYLSEFFFFPNANLPQIVHLERTLHGRASWHWDSEDPIMRCDSRQHIPPSDTPSRKVSNHPNMDTITLFPLGSSRRFHSSQLSNH